VEAQGERRGARKSGAQERAPKAQGEHRSPRRSIERLGRAELKRERRRSSKSGGQGRALEVQKEQRPRGSGDPRRAAREQRVQTQREW